MNKKLKSDFPNVDSGILHQDGRPKSRTKKIIVPLQTVNLRIGKSKVKKSKRFL